MTQDERWIAQWQEIIDFMEAEKRRPSGTPAGWTAMRKKRPATDIRTAKAR